MKLYFSLEMKVSAPKKTTTGISLECLGVKVDRTAGSVQRALEEALTEFGHQLRAPLLREARAARSQTVPPEEAVFLDKDPEPEVPTEAPAGVLPETFKAPIFPLFRPEGLVITGPAPGHAGYVDVTEPAPAETKA